MQTSAEEVRQQDEIASTQVNLQARSATVFALCQVRGFEFHGYFHSGYGLNSECGQQVAFQAPGAERNIGWF
jgi:maltoporin